MKKPYLDYYSNHNIIPVRQDVENLKTHLTRREGLYRSLGIIPALLAGKSVVELGPGTGDNAMFTAHLMPGRYLLVDGNQSSLNEVRAKLTSNKLRGNISVVDSDILEFTEDGQFDVVLCEGVIPNQANPSAFLRHVCRLAKVGGVVVLTTMSATSLLAEVCRRVLKPIIAGGMSFDQSLPAMTAFFAPDLKSLRGMSRRHEDWVLDNILHPWGNMIFTIPDVIAAVGDDFDFHGSSPHFMTDWRWYKEIVTEDFGFNRRANECYWKNSAAFIDYRCDPSAASDCDGAKVEELCHVAFDLQQEIWTGNIEGKLPDFVDKVDEIADTVAPILAQTAESLRNFTEFTRGIVQGKKDFELSAFRPLFGRGQQYVSLVRRG